MCVDIDASARVRKCGRHGDAGEGKAPAVAPRRERREPLASCQSCRPRFRDTAGCGAALVSTARPAGADAVLSCCSLQEADVMEEVEMMVESLLDVLLQTLLTIMSKSHAQEAVRGQRCPQCTAEITVSN